MQRIPSIVSGNDFKLKVHIYSPKLIDDNTELVDFDLSECTDIQVKLINSTAELYPTYTFDATSTNVIIVNIDFTLPVGGYALEIVGKTKEGANWRYKAKRGELFNIVDNTSAAYYNEDLTDETLFVSSAIGMLTPEVDDIYTAIDDIELILDEKADASSVPTRISQLINDAGYLTEHQDISMKANKSEISRVGRTGNYNDLSNKPIIPTVPTNISQLINDAGYLTEHQSLTDYALRSELFSGDYNDLSNKPIIPTVPTYVSSFINDAGYLTEHQSLTDYALRSELFSGDYNDLSNKPTIPDAQVQADWLENSDLSPAFILNKPTIPSLAGYATENWVSNMLNDILGIDASEVSTLVSILSDNDTTTGILEAIASKANISDIVNASYVTTEYLSQQSYLTQHQSLDNYVTSEYLSAQSYLTSHQSLDNYVTKTDLDNASYLTEHQSLENYVTKEDIVNASYVTSTDLSNAGYLTSHQSLDNYVTKTDLDSAGYLTSHQSLDGYVTSEYLSAQSYLTEHQSLDNYVTKTDLDNASYVTSTDLSNAGYLTSHQSLDNYVTKTDLDSAGYLTSHQSLDGYVTSEYLSAQSYLTEHQSLDNYVTKTDLDNTSYVTSTDLSNAGYLTSHQSLDNYVTKSDLDSAGYLTSHQSLDNYVTKNDLSNAGYLTSIPNIYVTKQQLDECTYINIGGTITESGTYSTNNISEFELDVQFNEDESLNIGFYSNNEYTNNVNLYLYSGDSGNTLTDEYFEVNYSLIEDYEKEEGDWWSKYRIKCNYPVISVIVDDGSHDINYSLTYGKSCTVIDNFDYYVSKTDLDNASYLTQSDISSMGYLTSHQSLANYYTKSEINNAGYLTSHQSLSNYYTKSEINNAGYLTSHQSLANYVTKTDLNNASYLTSVPSTCVTSTTSGLKIEVVAALPASPDSNTIYIVQ